MSQLWTFSPSSEPCLQRCIDAALLQDSDNKWTRKFGRRTPRNLDNLPISEENTAMDTGQVNSPEEIVEKPVLHVSSEEFFESLENDMRLDCIFEECSKNPNLFLEMAQRLSPNTVDKIFHLIFTSNVDKTDHLSSFFRIFLPNYLKRKNRITIDVLTKTCDKYPEIFHELLKILLEDTEIPNELLNNYISTLHNEQCTAFLENISNLVISTVSFNVKVPMIEMAYANCIKTEKIQNFIKNCLVTHKDSCTDNKNYGRLFMSYLKEEKSSGREIDLKLMKDCLETHRSPFKRPCLTLLKDLEN